MAGSMSWFDYADDQGTNYAIRMDTSNGVAVGNTAAAQGSNTLPRGIKPRYWVYISDDGLSTRRIPVSNPLTLPNPPNNLTLPIEGGSQNYNFAYSRGEAATRSRGNTGQQQFKAAWRAEFKARTEAEQAGLVAPR